MTKDIKKFKSKIVIYLSLAIICIGLIFSDDPLFIFFTLALFLWLLILVIFWTSRLIYSNYLKGMKFLNKHSSKIKFFNRIQLSEKNLKRLDSINVFFYKKLFPVLIVLFIFNFYLTGHMALFTHIKAEQNIPKFKELVSSIIEGKNSNESKAKALLIWFDNKTGNIFNDWRLKNTSHFIFLWDRGQLEFYSTYPFIGVRTYDNRDALWILTSKYGHCGEYSLLYRKMADYAGLRVRQVSTDGENHCWNEVYINDTIRWKIVDPTRVFLDEGINGYDDVNLTWLKNKLGGNISRVVAQELGGKYINVTRNYTTEINITVKTVNHFGKSISGAIVKLLSNNREVGRNTGLKGVTNSTGQYTFTVGIGNYTFKASNDNYYGKNTSIFGNENLHHNFRITMNKK